MRKLFFGLYVFLSVTTSVTNVAVGQRVTAVVAAISKGKQSYVPGGTSARSYTLMPNYTGVKGMWVYKCPGYDDPANSAKNYPLVIFLPGYGSTDGTTPKASFSNVNNSGEGVGYFLAQGDSPPNILICIPQNVTFNTDYSRTEYNAAYTYMAAHYRIDPNMVYGTGFSGGSIGLKDVIQDATAFSHCAAMIPISGPDFGLSGWSGFGGIGFWQHHGTADGTFNCSAVDGSLYWANGNFSGGPYNLLPNPQVTVYYGKAHASTVWDDEVYNRKNRTDATGTAKFDYIDWLKMHSKDATQQADGYTTRAEGSFRIDHYRVALQMVNNLSSGAPKTALLSRLSSLLTTINKGGTRYLISANNTFVTVSASGFNDWNGTFAATQGLTNIVDESNSASTIDFAVTNQYASSARDNNAGSNNAMQAQFFGLPVKYNLSGIVINHSITNGRITFSQVPTGKKTDIIVHHYHISGDDATTATISAISGLSVTANATTVTQYSAYNDTDYIEIDNVPESSGSFTLDMQTTSTRDVVVTGFELLVHP